MLNQYHPRAPLKSIFVQNDPKPYCHFVILSRLLVFSWFGWQHVIMLSKLCNENLKAMQWACQRPSLTEKGWCPNSRLILLCNLRHPCLKPQKITNLKTKNYEQREMEVCDSNGDCHPNSHCNKPWGRKLPCELKEKIDHWLGRVRWFFNWLQPDGIADDEFGEVGFGEVGFDV